jgi:hypothetical protein
VRPRDPIDVLFETPKGVAPMRAVSLATTAIAVALAVACAGRASSTSMLEVRLGPPVARLGQDATIAVAGVSGRSLEARLSGATDIEGRSPAWRPLRLAVSTWHGNLPAPDRLGVYPVELRTRAGAAPFRPRRSFLRVLERGTLARPAFDDPADVVRWWVAAVPHASVAALRPWPRSAFDGRDARLHREYVVAYSPSRDADVSDRLGMFVTAFRDGYGAPWRLLEATAEP